jgi:hypothetical protein
MSCYSQLVPIKAFVLKRQAMAGKMGQTFRELHILLQVFDWDPFYSGVHFTFHLSVQLPHREDDEITTMHTSVQNEKVPISWKQVKP